MYFNSIHTIFEFHLDQFVATLRRIENFFCFDPIEQLDDFNTDLTANFLYLFISNIKAVGGSYKCICFYFRSVELNSFRS